MFHIQTLNKISPCGLELLDKQKYRCGDDEQNPNAILVRSANMHEMEFGSKLVAIARAGAGVNNIPIDRCIENGIVVFNTPGANANAVKELVMCALLLSARKIFPAMEWVQSLKGQSDVFAAVEKNKSKFVGPELYGKKLGVIGMGAIGVRVANFARHFGMEVHAYDPYISVETAWKVSRDIRHASSLQEIYANCDFITLHLPCTSETKGMINSSSIQMMKHGVRILNFARGELVNTEDILAGLNEKQVRCYVTDFPDDALIGHPGVLAMPHIGASTPESEDNCAEMAVRQITDFLENGNIQNSVNLPNVSMVRSGDMRITLINKNVPSMIHKITTVLAESGANIENLTNKSKNDYAYTMVDVSGNVSEQLIEDLRVIPGVIRVNVFR